VNILLRFAAMNQRCIALLGRRDEPTDAVEEYCSYLGVALRPHGFALELARVSWHERGWRAALDELRRQFRELAWRRPVFVQYTALALVPPRIPFRFLRVLRILRASGARVAVVFPRRGAVCGASFRGPVAPRCATPRNARCASPCRRCRAHGFQPRSFRGCHPVVAMPFSFPVGANLPVPEVAAEPRPRSAGHISTVAVFRNHGRRSRQAGE